MVSFDSCLSAGVSVGFGNCENFLRTECEKEENAFGENCNKFLNGYFGPTVMNAYNERVQQWLNGNRGSWFGRRGWDPRFSGRDRNNIVTVCNEIIQSSNPVIDRCEEWFQSQCGGSQPVNVSEYPWCACMKDQGYNMAYYDPYSKVMNNDDIMGVGPGWGIDDPFPDNPYCFVDKCRDNPHAYKGKDNLRGNHQCPLCINIFDPVDTIFLNFELTQVCKGSGIPHPPTDIPDGSDPFAQPSSSKEWYEDGVVIGSIVALGFVFLIIVIRAILRGRNRVKNAQDESLIAALAITQRSRI